MTTTGTILLIDDVNEIGESVYAAAAALQMPWVTINDKSALQKLSSSDTALILFDPKLQKKDGTEVIRFLGEHHCKASIVLMSSGDTREIESAEKLVLNHGLSIAGRLLKPFRPTELERLLRQNAPEQGPISAGRNPVIEIDDRELRNAIKRKEFVLHYQPQIKTADGSVVGLEAFVRWRHPQRGLMFPDSFLSAIRDLGIIDELGWLVAERGFSEIRKFSDTDKGIPRLTLKLHAASLSESSFPDRFVSLAKRNDVPLHKIGVDVSGSGSLEQMASALEVLARLRMKGVSLTVGEYGRGIGIQQLRQISATELKIDRKIVQNIFVNKRDNTLVQKLILIAHELDMKAVAEGVETEQQLEFLCQKGCDYAQGFYVSHPMRPESMEAWLRGYHPRHCKSC